MKILVVVDMQNDFIDGALGTKEAVAIVSNVVEKIKGFDGRVVATYDTHHADYMNTQEGRNLPVPHCIEGTSGWSIADTVLDAMDDSVEEFFKPTFGSIELADWIMQRYLLEELEEVVLVGLCTDICVISNAMLIKAYAPEVKVTVDAACCAGVTPESHNNALSAMKMCQINIENWEA